jgi:hypothetical protein
VSKYYAFTRNVRDGVNAITATMLGTVWYIVNTKPTRVADGEAIWGPYTDALEPTTWRFRVHHEGNAKYAYTLEGRPKASSSDVDYVTVLSGFGYGREDDRHGDGEFEVDLDAARALDPLAHQKDSGTITVTHDLPPTVTEEFAPLPRQIAVTLAPSATAERLNVLSIARENSSGVLVVTGKADIDDSHATAIETVDIESQWDPSGAGRADVTITDGDVPAALSPFGAVECWDIAYKQSYYRESVAGNGASAVGQIDACAFQAPPDLD